MDSKLFVGSGIVLFFIELLYFRIAEKFQIIDRPNERSSHSAPIIRGGGILFFIGVMIWFVTSGFQWPWFVLAVGVIAIISFIDDIMSLNTMVRFGFQTLAILLIFYQLSPIMWPWYLIILAIVVMIGTLNAFNFMDGINGITGVNALVALLTFIYIQESSIQFTDTSLIILVSISVIVFLFFNFRTRARCFAGDVGSVTIALILVFFMLQLIIATHNFLWPVLFLVYGADSIITIVYRLKRGENILKAHRTHLYQYLSNEMRIPHLIVSIGYGATQVLLNTLFVYFFACNNLLMVAVLVFLFLAAYIFTRSWVMQRIRLIKAS
jgi:UDP-N-acetylmuramyl pentapeptide phosphotransferase/UDP-N-acetylglucosamine-1-phosphate transferase